MLGPMSLELTPTGGRYPGGRVLYEAANIHATLEQREGHVMIRIGDEAHSDRWESFTVPVRDLLTALLRHRDNAEEDELSEE